MSIFTCNNMREDAIFMTHVKGVLLRSHGGFVTALLDFRRRDEAAAAAGQSGISHAEFLHYLRGRGVELTDFQAQYLCLAFDDARDGHITARTFVRHLTGLNYRRMKAVEQAWDSLTKDSLGGVRRGDLIECYTATQELRGLHNSDLRYTFNSNERSAMKSSIECASAHGMSSSFSAEDAVESVSKDEFIAFYAGVSQRIGSDESFESQVLQEWAADSAVKPKLHSTQRDWGEEVDPLAIDGPRYVRDALNMELGRSSKSYNYSHRQRVHPYVEPLPPLNRPDLMRSTVEVTYTSYTASAYDAADPLVTRRGQVR